MFDGFFQPDLRGRSPRQVEADPLADINRTLLAHWPMLETGGPMAREISPRRAHAIPGATPSRTASRIGMLGSFNGSSHHLIAGSTLGHYPTYACFAFIRPNFSSSLTGTRTLLIRYASGSLYGMRLNWEGGIYGWYSDNVSGTGGGYNSTATSFSAGEVHHIGFSYDAAAASAQFWWDGKPVTTSLTFAGWANANLSGAAFYIGSNAGANWWDGAIGRVRVFGRVPTAAEVLALYRQPLLGTFAPEDRIFVAFHRPAAVATVSLTGIALTGSAGTTTAAISMAPTGSAATVSAGTASSAIGMAASGSAGTVSAGTTSAAIGMTASGSAGTSASGTLTGGIGMAASGTEVTASAGTTASAIGTTISGSALTVSAGSLAYTIGFILTGEASSASGGTLATSGGDTTQDRSLTGISMTAMPGNVRVTGGTRWRPQSAQPVVPPSMVGNTLPPPPRLVGNPAVDTQAQQQWLQTVYDKFIKELNALGRLVDHENRIARLETPDDAET